VARGRLDVALQTADSGVESGQQDRELDLLRQRQRLLPGQHAGSQRPQLAHALDRQRQLLDGGIDQVSRGDVGIIGQRIVIGDAALQGQQFLDQATVGEKVLARISSRPPFRAKLRLHHCL
jgi:hypothetical protein